MQKSAITTNLRVLFENTKTPAYDRKILDAGNPLHSWKVPDVKWLAYPSCNTLPFYYRALAAPLFLLYHTPSMSTALQVAIASCTSAMRQKHLHAERRPVAWINCTNVVEALPPHPPKWLRCPEQRLFK